MDELRNYLAQIIDLSDASMEAYTQLFSEVELKKGDYFACEGRVETNLGFLKNGVLRAFYRSSEGLEYNKTFFTEKEFFGAYSSLVTGQINQINIQALTDCTILMADYEGITRLFEEYREIEKLARVLGEYLYVYKEKREIELVILQADERYKRFRKEYPNLENLIPQYHIASYLGITPTQLSRIRMKKE